MNHIKKALFSAILLGAGSAAYGQGQVIYSTNFENYTTAGTLSGQNGWVTNDDENFPAETATTQVGGLNQVVTGANSFNGSNAAQLLGGYSAGGVTGYPGTSPVTLTHPINLASQGAAGTLGYQFDTDFVASSTQNGIQSNFGFVFQVGSDTLFSINLTPDTMNGVPANTKDQLGFTVGGVTTVNSDVAVTLDGRYHLTVTVSPSGNVSASYYGLSDPSTVVSIGSVNATSSVELVDSVGVYQAGGTTADTAAHDALTFDNFAVTVVPEPSTYAMIGLGLLGLVGMMKFRRHSA